MLSKIWERRTEWLPMIIWMSFIFFWSHQPTISPIMPDFGVWDLLMKKGAHFISYAILYLLIWRAFPDYRWGALLVAILYGASDEYHQTFIFGRMGRMADVLIDGLGAVAAFYGQQYWFKRKAIAEEKGK